VRWGLITLPAGTYSYSVKHGSAETVVLRNATGVGSMVMASSTSMMNPSGSSKITLQQQDGEWFVISMQLGDDCEELRFAPPKRSEIARDSESRAKLASISKP
ncbi:MAG: hypothetical protein DMG81_18740, partial [Acidobacteria bacterium]